MANASGDAGVPGAGCWINTLPEEVLLRAISRLDARQLVQTCVLSRRWRHLWRSVPRINVSRDEFEGMAETWEECDALFKKFVSRFLMLRNPTPLDEFNLSYCVPDYDCMDYYDAASEDANLWIGHALQCNARCVKVSVSDARLYLHSALFASKCLLTSLELSWVVLFCGFFKSLQTGCTMLERLILCGCDIEDIDISSQTLKVLSIDALCNFDFTEQASISIPSLSYLGFFAHERIPLLKNMESLVTARVSVGDRNTQVQDICQFLESLSGVTDLDFNYQGRMLKMENDLQLCPQFDNLTVLTLGTWWLHADFCAFRVFLQNSPYLVKLTQVNETFSRFIGELKDMLFTCEHLEIVEIVCVEGDSVTNTLEKLLLESGITTGQMDMKRLEGTCSIFLKRRV
ncbi:hypothetical protein ACP70R_019744 [Stipagrostis hirtigluma subsp. patula]